MVKEQVDLPGEQGDLLTLKSIKAKAIAQELILCKPRKILDSFIFTSRHLNRHLIGYNVVQLSQ